MPGELAESTPCFRGKPFTDRRRATATCHFGRSVFTLSVAEAARSRRSCFLRGHGSAPTRSLHRSVRAAWERSIARDARLGRSVALKVLPAFARDAERLARFRREAQVVASLNHPHIAAIHGFEESEGVQALVLELVEVPTLADRISAAPIALDEALSIARQIAEALEAAHEQGIVHRDLKPANIKLRPDGTVKVLDFGLAKALDPAITAIDVTQSPTITSPAMVSAAGLILGTAAYMSPERAAGKPVDKRADIWAFGVILWEMLTGKRLFDGETVPHTLADVLRAEIDFSKLPSGTPLSIRELLRRCVDRNLKNRLRDIGEARVAIDKYLADPATPRDASITTAPSSGARSPMLVAAIAVAAIAIVAAAVLSFVHFREQPRAVESVRFQILPPDETTFATGAVLSPDGRRLAFAALGPDGRTVLWVRSLDSLDARPLPGTENAAPGPFWSPDSRFLAFGVNGTPGRLRRVDVSAGPAQTVSEYIGGFREGAWSAEGIILFGVYDGAGSRRSGLWQVPAVGSTASPVTEVDLSRGEVQHAGPTFLRDGRRFLYHRASRAAESNGIYVGSLDVAPDAQSTSRLLPSDSDPQCVPSSDSSGDLVLFLREGTLFAQSLSDQLTLIGNAIPVAEDVANLGTHGWFSASATGNLAFRNGRAAASTTELLWVDRQGNRIGQVGPRANRLASGGVQISPDGKRVVLTRTEAGALTAAEQRAWTAEIERGIFSRPNPGDGTESTPVISPDGRVAFSSTTNGAVGDLYWMSASGVGSPEPLLLRQGPSAGRCRSS